MRTLLRLGTVVELALFILLAPGGATGASDSPPYSRLFIHLVPDNEHVSIAGAGNDIADMTYSVVPQVRETSERLLKLFGRPDRIDKQERKFNELGPSGLPTVKTVTGDCWVYGPLTLMLREGKVTYIWLQGSFEPISRAYAEAHAAPTTHARESAGTGTVGDDVSGRDPLSAPNPDTRSAPNRFEKPPAGWPGYSDDATGSMEVRVTNPNDFKVRVGLRSGATGKDFIVAASATQSAYVRNGSYDIYFQYSTDPEGLYQGDAFTLNDNGVHIQIVKVVGGNYGIRKLR